MYFSIVISFLSLLACSSSKTDEVESFIPGTYVRFSDHEMRKEYDTLSIDVLSEAGNKLTASQTSPGIRLKSTGCLHCRSPCKRMTFVALQDQQAFYLK